MSFDTLMRYIVLPGGFLVLFILANWFANRQEKKALEKALADGSIRYISQAEYNRSFGIENKLTVVKNNK
jgi:hypothetical protein